MGERERNGESEGASSDRLGETERWTSLVRVCVDGGGYVIHGPRVCDAGCTAPSIARRDSVYYTRSLLSVCGVQSLCCRFLMGGEAPGRVVRTERWGGGNREKIGAKT